MTAAHLTANVAHDDATLAASAGSLSGNTLTLPLDVGPNEVSFTVTAQDGQTTKTYTVVITRAAEPTLTVVASPAKPGSTKPEFTTNPNVQLKITAPAGTKVEISNDPGFNDTRIFDVVADGSYPWTLTGDGQHTVYVRFPDVGAQPPLDETVKLDATAPTITKARFVKRRNGRVWVSVAAVDTGSGVAQHRVRGQAQPPLGLAHLPRQDEQPHQAALHLGAHRRRRRQRLRLEEDPSPGEARPLDERPRHSLSPSGLGSGRREWVLGHPPRPAASRHARSPARLEFHAATGRGRHP